MRENTTSQSVELENLKKNYQQFLVQAKEMMEQMEKLEAEKTALEQELKEAYQQIANLNYADLLLQKAQQKEQNVKEKNVKLENLRLNLLKKNEELKNKENELKFREQQLQEREQSLEATITAFKREAYEEANNSVVSKHQELSKQELFLIEQRLRFQEESNQYEKNIELKYKNQSIDRINQEITKFKVELITIGIILITLMALALVTNRSVFASIGQDIKVIFVIGSGIWETIIGVFALALTVIGFGGIFYFRNQAPSIIGFALRLSVITFILSISAKIGIDTATIVIEVFAIICGFLRMLC